MGKQEERMLGPQGGSRLDVFLGLTGLLGEKEGSPLCFPTAFPSPSPLPPHCTAGAASGLQSQPLPLTG